MAAPPVLSMLLVTASPGQRRLPPGRSQSMRRRPGTPIPSNLYGIFFEEISHAGDGGLYAELIQNRGFEDARLPPMTHARGRVRRAAAHAAFRHRQAQATGGCAGTSSGETPGMDAGHARRCACVDATGRRPSAHRGDTACTRGRRSKTSANESAGGSQSSTKASGGSTSKRMPNTNSRFYARSDGQFAGPIQAVLESADGTDAGARAHDQRT